MAAHNTAVGGRRSAVGGRRSAVGGRRSAVGGRRSAVGGREPTTGTPAVSSVFGLSPLNQVMGTVLSIGYHVDDAVHNSPRARRPESAFERTCRHHPAASGRAAGRPCRKTPPQRPRGCRQGQRAVRPCPALRVVWERCGIGSLRACAEHEAFTRPAHPQTGRCAARIRLPVEPTQPARLPVRNATSGSPPRGRPDNSSFAALAGPIRRELPELAERIYSTLNGWREDVKMGFFLALGAV